MNAQVIKDIGEQGFNKIKAILTREGYNLNAPENEEEQGHKVANFKKKFDYNDEKNDEYMNYGTIKVNIVFDKNSSGGTRKRIIKRKKATRRNRKTKK